MAKAVEKTRWSVVLVAVLGMALGCTSPRRAPSPGAVKSALTTSNGFAGNGLTTNGIWTNGIWTNGIWTNGIWTNGIWTNGIWTNGIWTNGIWTNGIWTNGIWTNGIWTNGIWTNGKTGDAAVPGNALRGSVYARQLLQYVYSCAMPATTYDTTLDPNNGALLCSTPDAGAGGAATCDDGYTCSSTGTCVVPLRGAIGLGINDDGTTWWGQPAPGGATDLTVGKWGQCDESCQRWVSACVLARTNAYGVHVNISMRPPAAAPAGSSPGRQLQFAAIKAALAPDASSNEVIDYKNREGAYYGNIFSTTPLSSTKGPCTTLPNGTVTCQSVGPMVGTPSFYACAGPDSNTPEITKRFCSSQGDQVVIRVPGLCAPRTTELGSTAPGVCDGIDATGSIRGCNTCAPNNAACLSGADCCSNSCSIGGRCTGTATTAGKHYEEVITVYQQQPLAACGNGVCEAGEAPSDPQACESDCHPGTWAKDYLSSLGEITFPGGTLQFATVGLSAVAPDDTVVLTGNGPAGGSIDLGGGGLPASQGVAVLAKYDPQGHHLWSKRFGATPPASGMNALTKVGGVTVAPNGNIVVVGATRETATFRVAPVVYTFGADGGTPAAYAGGVVPVAIAVLPTNVPTLASTGSDMTPYGRTAVDSHGNVVMTAHCAAPAKFGSFMLNPRESSSLTPPTDNVCVVKVSPSGAVLWAKSVEGESTFPLSLVADANDDIVMVTTGSTKALQKMSGADGSVIWFRDSVFILNAPAFWGAGVDASGNVYATGMFSSGNFSFGSTINANLATMLNPANPAVVFGGPVPAVTGHPPFIAKYDKDGVFQWVSYANIVCPQSLEPNCSNPPGAILGVRGLNISFDSNDNVILGSYGGAVGGGIDFGVGTFPTYTAPNIFLAAYSTKPANAGQLVWAKQIPMVLKSSVSTIDLDSHGRVIVSGAYSGSMQIDGSLLMTGLPEDPNTAYAYLSSFASPSSNDKTPPVIGFTTDQTGAPIVTVPRDFQVEATNKCGATVFYMPPTAVDTGDPVGGAPPTGATVACSPPPNTLFPINTSADPSTTVRCTASDPLGNKSEATFHVTVADTIAPVLAPPADVTQPASDANGAIVTFTAPAALDQVDCSSSCAAPTSTPAACITSTCTPASGSLFAIGRTTVTCVASDMAQNQAQTTFSVNVTAPDFGGPCSPTAPCAFGACVDGVCCNLGDPTKTSCDPCQACNVAGSVGTCAPTSGGTCSDHNECTQSDTCQNGTCVGGNAVTCSASDQCHEAGTCDPATGTCSSPPVANGTACTDGNECTRTDTCQAGTCTGANPVTCAASDQCHLAGSCNPSTGTCSNPVIPDGAACTDGNQCSVGDACVAGACVANAGASCDDQNPCTVDSCDGGKGCVHTPGNGGAPCRAAGSACDSGEVCTGSSAVCPAGTDKLPPALAPGANQTVVGNCSGSAVVFTVPALASSSCESGTNLTCSWTQGSSHGTCGRSGSGTSLPGNRYGTFAVSCTAKDAAGNVSTPVAFTVTVLQPLTVRIQPPLSGDNNTRSNVVKLGSTVPTKVRLLACGTDVTKTAAVVAKIGTTYVSSGGATASQTIGVYSDTPDTGGVMKLDGANYRYNLSTKGLSATAGIPAFYQESITVTYKSAPTVVVGTDTIQLDMK